MNISQAVGDGVDTAWTAVEPLIERALKHSAGDRTTAELLKAKIKLGQANMWVAHEDDDVKGVVVISLLTYPAKRTVSVDLVAGTDAHLWQEKVESLLADVKDLVGASSVEAYVRPGLVKKLEKRWQSKATLVELK